MRLDKEKVLLIMADRRMEFKDLAEKMKMNKSNVSLHLSNKRPKQQRHKTIYNYCNALGCEPKDIIENVEAKATEVKQEKR